jgi:biotin transport system substrate-specific component
MISQAIVPLWTARYTPRALYDFLAVVAGASGLALLAQVSLPLPFTPVPITGQTLGVAVLALGWGSRRAPAAFALYLGEAAIGLPVLAGGASGWNWGPTAGYLVGMAIASYVVGRLADHGAARTFRGAFFAAATGSAITFACGLAVLSYFVPSEALFASGFWPFVPGDILKNLLAASVASTLAQKNP